MANWIWYPGDFEIYHGMLQNFSREERGMWWPAYWYISDCYKNVKFEHEYTLTETTSFTVYSNSMGYVRVNDQKYRFGEKIVCEPHHVYIEIFAGSPTGLPAALVEGETIQSDGTWKVSDMSHKPVLVGYNERYIYKEQDPSVWEYDTKICFPVSVRSINGGQLYDFGEELTAILELKWNHEFKPILICYGESETEALDVKNCYYSQKLTNKNEKLIRRAFQYIFIPEIRTSDIDLKAIYSFVNIPVRSYFHCEDELINKIWDVSTTTFKLASGIFFIDGIKRDRWIWSGDSYQSQFINQYLFHDYDICKRTLWALRGKDPLHQHINTIVDYSMYWIIGILQYYQMSDDLNFVKAIYPRVKTMMEFLMGQLDDNGFIIGRKGDWIFIDWTDMDREGPVCAEQMLLATCYETASMLEKLIAKEEPLSTTYDYSDKRKRLLENIEKFFWDEEKGAYIDSFVSGKRHVTRHGNIFAILFGIADKKRAERITKNVVLNSRIPQITTPYFKFYELEIMCHLGMKKQVLNQIRSYWGGMLQEGAVTFWEEYDPSQTGKKHYEMYGDPYGKSLCHAWGASPIYLIGRYFAGVRPTSPGYKTFEVKPDTENLGKYQCSFPVGQANVTITWDGAKLSVYSEKEGGTLIWKGREIPLKAGVECIV